MAQAPEGPAGASRFALELDGVEVAWFLGCDGPSSRTEVVEIVEGGVNDRVHKRPGATRWRNLVLRTAVAATGGLWEWRDACRQGDFETRRSGALTVLRDDGSVVRRYGLVGMWPVRWSGPDLDAGGSALALEELEVSVDDVQIEEGDRR